MSTLTEAQIRDAIVYNSGNASAGSARVEALLVAAFQAANGLLVDGKLGPKTMHALFATATPELVEAPTWRDGYWSGARAIPMHAGRIGGAISPWSIVVHTTDMVPRSFGALIRAWQASSGKGNGAHFLIGRGPEDGVVQFCPITRNANHAGGPQHGWFERDVAPATRRADPRIHPNSCTIGIEIHNAGRLRRNADDEWANDDDERFDDGDVIEDRSNPNKGWHEPTAWQLARLDELLDALEPRLGPAPSGVRTIPNGTPPAYATAPSPALVGHVTLDPARKSDPGPVIMQWLRDRWAAKHTL